MADTAGVNLFMICPKPNENATSELPGGFHFRLIRPDELDVWKRLPFDDEKTADAYYGFMNGYFERVYAPRISEFYNRCLFVCDENDDPVGSCFLWKAYRIIPTLHWFKVRKDFEGKGIGRALLSEVLKNADYPIYLHTQPGSFRAIKLYSDFGFVLLLDPVIGARNNEIETGLPYLKEHMPEKEYAKLRFDYAPKGFLYQVGKHMEDEF